MDTLILALVLYFILGIFAGTLSGLLGLGGGVIVVPGLFMLFQYLHFEPQTMMHVAAGSSLTIMVMTTSRGLHAHLKRKIVIWPIYRRLFLGVILGVGSGAVLAHWVPSHWLEIIFALFLMVIALHLLTRHHRHASRELPRTWVNQIVGFFIGFKSGLLGIGGGALTTPYLRFFNIPFRSAMVVATAVSLTVAVIGSGAFMLMGQQISGLPAWHTGYVYWPAVAGVACGSVLFAPIGVALSQRLPVALLQRIFALLLLLMSVHLLF